MWACSNVLDLLPSLAHPLWKQVLLAPNLFSSKERSDALQDAP